MKIVKISAIWCGACLIMNKVWSKLKDNYNFEAIELDYDMDEEEVKKYNVGDKLPVFIVFNQDKELARITGEFSYDEFIEKLDEVGVKLEEIN
jgi:thiol-disulfide isomerase/thioredoxin